MESYSELFKTVNDYRNHTGLVTCFPCRGNHYEDATVRLMVIGRCLNGWKLSDKFSGKIDNTVDVKSYISMSEDVWQEKERLDFIPNQTRSAFWQTVRLVYKYISGLQEAEDSDKWYENIAWYNMFPVAPSEGGNPSDLLFEIQREPAKILLNYVLDKLEPRPTHILFETGWEGWMTYSSANQQAISSCLLKEGKWDFDEYWETPGKNKEYDVCMLDQINENERKKAQSSENDPKTFVIWTGRIYDIPTVIAKRPERKPREEYAQEIAAAFK